MADPARGWLNREIPLWGVVTLVLSVLVAGGGWLVNLEFRVRSMETDAVAFKSSYKAVEQAGWEMKSVAQNVSAMREDMKVIARLNVDVLILQRDVQELACRTGGRCETRK